MKTKFTSLFSLLLGAFFSTSTIQAQSLQWAKSIAGPSNQSKAIAVDASGNVYTTGSFTGTTDFDPGVGTFTIAATPFSEDLFLSKVDASGNFVWAKSFGGTGNYDIGNAVTFDATGNVYVSGYFSNTVDFDPGVGTFILTDAGGLTGFLVKLNAVGNFVLAKNFGGNPQSISVDAGGNIYFTGSYQGTNDFDPGVGTNTLTAVGSQDCFILKLDAAANFVWAKSVGGSGTDNAFAIAVDVTGNVYTTGGFNGTADFDPSAGTFTLSSTGAGDVYISKLDALGNFVWVKTLGSTFTNDFGTAIKLDAAGNIYATGATFNGFLTKLDPAGNFIFTKNVGTNVPQALALDGSGNVFISGGLYLTSDFDPSPATFTVGTSGGFDVFVSQFDLAGNFITAFSVGGADYDLSCGAACDASGNLYITGYFKGTADFDPLTTSTVNLTSPSANDANSFTAKYGGSSSTGINTNKNQLNSISVYPNPFSDKIIFQVKESKGSAISVVIYNSIGQLISSGKSTLDKIIIETQNLPIGVYFYKATQEGNVIASGKLIAE